MEDILWLFMLRRELIGLLAQSPNGMLLVEQVLRFFTAPTYANTNIQSSLQAILSVSLVVFCLSFISFAFLCLVDFDEDFFAFVLNLMRSFFWCGQFL
jgi:hypothetical protein